MYLHELIKNTLSLLLITFLFIVFSKQVFVNKRIFSRSGKKKYLDELNWFERIGVYFLVILNLVVCIILFLIYIPYIKDISAYKSGKYEVIENSNVEKVQHIKDSRSISYELITINGVDYKIEEDTEIKEGDLVQIFYLHNTKIIMDYTII